MDPKSSSLGHDPIKCPTARADSPESPDDAWNLQVHIISISLFLSDFSWFRFCEIPWWWNDGGYLMRLSYVHGMERFSIRFLVVSDAFSKSFLATCCKKASRLRHTLQGISLILLFRWTVKRSKDASQAGSFPENLQVPSLERHSFYLIQLFLICQSITLNTTVYSLDMYT